MSENKSKFIGLAIAGTIILAGCVAGGVYWYWHGSIAGESEFATYPVGLKIGEYFWMGGSSQIYDYINELLEVINFKLICLNGTKLALSNKPQNINKFINIHEGKIRILKILRKYTTHIVDIVGIADEQFVEPSQAIKRKFTFGYDEILLKNMKKYPAIKFNKTKASLSPKLQHLVNSKATSEFNIHDKLSS